MPLFLLGILIIFILCYNRISIKVIVIAISAIFCHLFGKSQGSLVDRRASLLRWSNHRFIFEVVREIGKMRVYQGVLHGTEQEWKPEGAMSGMYDGRGKISHSKFISVCLTVFSALSTGHRWAFFFFCINSSFNRFSWRWQIVALTVSLGFRNSWYTTPSISRQMHSIIFFPWIFRFDVDVGNCSGFIHDFLCFGFP